MESTPQWKSYSGIIVDNVFDCIAPGSRVLEIGPFDGWFSDLILQKNPKLVEWIFLNLQ